MPHTLQPNHQWGCSLSVVRAGVCATLSPPNIWQAFATPGVLFGEVWYALLWPQPHVPPHGEIPEVRQCLRHLTLTTLFA
eukprot:3894617-Amphidinium_carterae.1